MTGIDPAPLSNEISRRARQYYWRSRIFLVCYLLCIGGFVLAAVLAVFLVNNAVRDMGDNYAHRFMRGTVTLIEETLSRHDPADWPQVIKGIDEKFSYSVSLLPRAGLALPKPLLTRIDQGDITIDYERDEVYHAVRDSGMVLMLGSFAPGRIPDMQIADMPLGQHSSRLNVWIIICALFGIGLLIVLWPMLCDLEALRQTTCTLAVGHLEARAPGARSRLFAPLTDTLNGMADHIQRLLASQKELSCAISHELRTPIARLRFASEMVLVAKTDEERKRLGQMMESDLDELDELIDASLTHARFEQDAPILRMRLRPVNLSEWLKEELDRLQPLCQDKTLRLDLGALSPDQTVKMDGKYMARALSNLVRNAVRYAQQHIVIGAEMVDENVFLHVDDDGIGIPEAERQQVFTAFTRLDRSRDRSTGGYGLGLSITRRILELHGGQASAHASPLGGARFTLSWPGRED
jgi:two-component system sensor histidine kinase RstB